MSIKEEIGNHILSDIELVHKIQKLMVKIEIMSDNERDMLLAGFSRNAISHFVSINILIDKKLYNSAFALMRVFFENIVKLRYMYYIMNDAKITTIYNANSWDNHFPTMQEMTDEIDDFIGIELYSEIKQNAYKMMCDYTHTGANQIRRNFSETELTVESNFNDELILETLKNNKSLLKTAIVVFLESIGFRNGFISKAEMDNFLEY